MSIFQPKIKLSSSLSWSPCWLLEVVADHQSQCVTDSLVPASDGVEDIPLVAEGWTIGLEDLWRSLPTQTILWFSNSPKHRRSCHSLLVRLLISVKLVFLHVWLSYLCDTLRQGSLDWPWAELVPSRASLAPPGVQKAWFGDKECQWWPWGFGWVIEHVGIMTQCL